MPHVAEPGVLEQLSHAVRLVESEAVPGERTALIAAGMLKLTTSLPPSPRTRHSSRNGTAGSGQK